jgi:hypothetical protein
VRDSTRAMLREIAAVLRKYADIRGVENKQMADEKRRRIKGETK